MDADKAKQYLDVHLERLREVNWSADEREAEDARRLACDFSRFLMNVVHQREITEVVENPRACLWGAIIDRCLESSDFDLAVALLETARRI